MALGDFRIDPSVKVPQGKVMPAPDGHPRRCQSYVQGKTRQCGQYACFGSHYCKCHRGTARRSKATTMADNYYRKHVSTTLGKMLDDYNSMDHSEKKSLVAELGIAKSMAVDALKTLDLCIENGDKVSLAVKMQASGILSRALDQVSRIAVNLAKVEALAPEQLTKVQADTLIAKMSKILVKYFDEDPRIIAILQECGEMSLPENPGPSIQLVIE